MRRKAKGLMLLFIMLPLTGCWSEGTAAETTEGQLPSIELQEAALKETAFEKPVVNEFQQNEETAITLTPVDLFEGEGARFQHFLGPNSASYKLEYDGSKPDARLDIDIVEKGKTVKSAGSLGDLFFSHNKQWETNEIELIISIDTITHENEKIGIVKVNVVHPSGSGMSTFTLPLDNQPSMQTLMQHHDSRTIVREEETPLFGLQASSSNSIRAADLSSGSLSEVEWALLCTLRFDDGV